MTEHLHRELERAAALASAAGVSRRTVAKAAGLPNSMFSEWVGRAGQPTYKNHTSDARNLTNLRAACERLFPTVEEPSGASDEVRAEVMGVAFPDEEYDLPQPDDGGAPPEVAIDVEGRRVLVIADLHIPHHDLAALTAALDHGRARDVDAVVLLGDVADFYAASNWDRDPNRRDLMREIGLLRQFFQVLRARFRGVPIYYHLGNHEERLERYLTSRAPELFNVDALALSSLLWLDKLGGFTLTDRAQYLRLGRLAAIHGHEFGGMMTNPVNPARGLWLRALESAICGHFHVSSQHTERTAFSGKVRSCWSLGALCNLRPRYRPANRWSHGFAVVEVDGRDYDVSNHRIIDGRVY